MNIVRTSSLHRPQGNILKTKKCEIGETERQRGRRTGTHRRVETNSEGVRRKGGGDLRRGKEKKVDGGKSKGSRSMSNTKTQKQRYIDLKESGPETV